MASRPRRSAAQRATRAITDMADRDLDISDDHHDPPSSRTMSSRTSSRRSGNGAVDGNTSVKLPPSKLRQTTLTSNGSISKSKPSGSGNRTRGGKKSYVIESSEEEEDDVELEDDDEEEEEDDDEPEEDEIKVDTRARYGKTAARGDEEDAEGDEDMQDLDDEDAEGEEDPEEMDVDADADADGDIDMDPNPAPPQPPTIKITKPSKTTAPAKPANKAAAARDDEDDDDDDDELSELGSEPEDVTVEVAQGDEDAEGEEDEDVDAEGEEEEEEEIEGGAGGDEDDEDDDLLSDDDDEGTSRAETPDLSKLTARQRAKLGGASLEYMKLSDEVQAKKHFTAEELSMRRAEMARRRRNLSEKRNEEVKMETINKLLKKQAPKTTRKNALLAAQEEAQDTEPQRPDPMCVRWINNRSGSLVAVPEELLAGPAGSVFLPPNGGVAPRGRGLGMGKMVEEVS